MQVYNRKSLRDEAGIRFSDTHLDRLIQTGEFPKPFKIGRRDHWMRDRIDQYLADKATDSAAVAS